jgi:hypothetical protein
MIRDDKGQPVPLSAVYPEIEIGALLDPNDVRYSAVPVVYRSAWEIASASRFKGSSERSRLP